MIHITRLNKSEMVINADLIEFIEATPDTILTLTTGQKIIVREKVEEVVDKVIQFKRQIYQGPIQD
ncbi:flagellar FlbD family protein [Candidatus Latescibacterota bacterium]